MERERKQLRISPRSPTNRKENIATLEVQPEVEEQLKKILEETHSCWNCQTSFKQPHHLVCHIKRCLKRKKPESGNLEKRRSLSIIENRRKSSFEEASSTVDEGEREMFILKEETVDEVVLGNENFQGKSRRSRRMKKIRLDGKEANDNLKISEVTDGSALQSGSTFEDSGKSSTSKLSRNRSKKSKRKLLGGDEEKGFECPKCSYKTNTRNSFNKHLKLNHTPTNGLNFQCDECSYSSSKLAYLQQHVRTHSDNKPFKCEYCPSTFRFSGGVIAHRRIHTGDRPFRCKICSFKGTQSSTLNNHMKGHRGQFEFKCAICPYWSSKQHQIQRHEITCHLESAEVPVLKEPKGSVGQTAQPVLKSRRRKKRCNTTMGQTVQRMPKKRVNQASGRIANKPNKKIYHVSLPVLRRPNTIRGNRISREIATHFKGTKNLVDTKDRRGQKFKFFKPSLFNFQDIKIDLGFMEAHVHKCDVKLRLLPTVSIFGEANLRSKVISG